MSTTIASAALCRDNELLANETWGVRRGNSGVLFEVLDEILSRHDLAPEQIDGFGVGLGPGSFTGLRISISAMRAMALPDATPVIGVSSAEAIAAAIAATHPNLASIAIVGDARRDRLWFSEFSQADGQLTQTRPFVLMPTSELGAAVSDGALIATPDWASLEERLADETPSDATLIQEPTIPTAAHVAQRAAVRQHSDTTPLKLEPIYMHPPVFVEPRYATSATPAEPIESSSDALRPRCSC